MGSLARRVLVTSDTERKRLERALHDGAQQRLVAATTTLGLALRKLEAGEDGAQQLAEEAADELRRCVEDLRDLAREIYPTVLAERGLASALNDLARRAPGPVELRDVPATRLPEDVELAAYLVVSEALAALADGAEASVSADATDGRLVVEVHGAALRGEQLERLWERVEVLHGSIESGPDEGAPFVRASLPVVID